jgi:hypothetical protein
MIASGNIQGADKLPTGCDCGAIDVATITFIDYDRHDDIVS